ncbi:MULTISPECIES: sigma-54 dependent transcriptional regulator [Pseudoalteromonas]|uniref:sigma-54-dependent transcriptional regulator n=1 Tax=Pseudoalteromonas TaxID=53246 RepID=UPI00078465FB|nr:MULTISPECIES: sigma-54 dependent transcriptional regulator [Pseudoalteromonas]MCF7519819.1 sigma-54 dependent transcriptional regulator [Pseudoalteromonas sp. L21]UJX26220.1 sigma-54 dependent transcriptional regulator [Pseudoalteromonas sp. CF6-2]|tara:strand:+ start:14053 stop:15396 length:1344 start_codon:yes stop_codon:yes gene_type:complete
MLNVLLVDDDSEFSEVVCHIVEFLGHNINTAANLAEAEQWFENNTFDHVFLDFMLPDGSGLHLLEHLKLIGQSPRVTLISGHPSVKGKLAEMCEPNVGHLVKPLQREDIERVLNPKKASGKKKATPSIKRHFGTLIGESEVMQKLYTMIERVAATSANVMLMGESGAGKEVVAQAIHNATQCDGPLVATNCGAFSKELIGSELFGHEKGAFTGAVARKEGVFEQAAGGTLFLDEVTEMPIDMQPNLLRVLESKRVTRVGGTKEQAVNCRVISATNRTLTDLAQNNVIREDIYFRLAVFPIDIPPLRERKEDIPLLAEAFLDQLNDENGTSFKWQASQIKVLEGHDWPGNVRELRHAIHRAFIMSDPKGSTITLPDSLESPFSRVNKKAEANNQVLAGQTIEEVEKELIHATLDKVQGNKTIAAQMLGISTKTLYNRLNAYGGIGEYK